MPRVRGTDSRHRRWTCALAAIVQAGRSEPDAGGRPNLERWHRRRGFALANKGYDLRLIQDYLGHRDPRHTVHYTRTAGRRFEGLWR